MAFPALPGPQDAMVLALAVQLEASQWWTAEALERAQMRQLEVLLRHAWRTTPYYRPMVSRLKGIPSGGLTRERFCEIPVLTRPRLQDAGDELASTAPPDGHGERRDVTTSGSTGRPVTVTTTAVTNLFFLALNLRFHLWFGRDFAGTVGAIKKLRGPEERLGREGKPQAAWAPCFATGPMHYLDILEPTARQLDWLAGLDPSILLSCPSNVADLLRLSEETGVRPRRLTAVSTMGEVVDPELYALCERVWGAPLQDCYSCQEMGFLAVQCPEHRHYHVQSESVFVEVLDDDDEPCRPGETGRVVATDLHNFAMPLIRYEVGDYAEVGEPCPCGRGLPVLRRVQGRVRNMLTLPNGERKWPMTGLLEMCEVVPLKQYRMVQKSLETVEVQAVVARPVTEDEERRLREIVVRKLTHPFDVRFAYVDEIPRDAGGKFEDFRSELA